MLNSRQKLAEQLLSSEQEFESQKANEQNAEKKAPPKFKRPGIKSENDLNTEKKSKVNLNDLLDNYEKHELPEADLNKISSDKQEIKNELQSEITDTATKNKEVDLHKQQAIEAKANEQKEFIIASDSKAYNKAENKPNNKNLNLTEINKLKTNIVNESTENELNSASKNLIENKNILNEKETFNNNDNKCMNDIEAEEDNATSHINLNNQSENTFDEINLNNTNHAKQFKDLGSSTSINPKNALYGDEIGSTNNLFESATSHAKNFLENLSAANAQNAKNNNNDNNINTNNDNNDNNTLDNYSNIINLASEKQSYNNLIVADINANHSDKDLITANQKHADHIDFNINQQNQNKSFNNNSENNHASQGEDNLSIPEINCKSIELTNENYTEKKQSTNSSNLNLNNQSNGNYQETKDFNYETNNFFSNSIENPTNKFESVKNNLIKITNFDDEEINKQNDYNENDAKEINNFDEKEISNANNLCCDKYHKEEDISNNGNSISENHRINILENEINNLRKIINEFKKKEIEENESMQKLEIINLKNIIKSKSSENQLLQSENKNLKSHIKMLQENISTFFSDKKISLDSNSNKEAKVIQSEETLENKAAEKTDTEAKEEKHSKL